MAEIVSLADAVRELVDDGQTVALEGFTHLIPHAAGHELIRQGKRDLTLVRITPDLGIVHAQQADRRGNVQLWGIVGVQKEVVLASARTIVTVEEVVDELEPRHGAVVLPGWVVDAVAVAPGGAHPSYADGYYDRD